MVPSWVSAEAVVREFESLSTGDRRLDERARSLARDFSRRPGKSIPKVFRSSAKREGAYRFFGNPTVTPDNLLAPHINETLKRVGAQTVVRVVHDTTRLAFSGDREGLATLSKETRGFYAHVALAVGGTELREPLGVLGLRCFTNDDKGVAARRKLTQSQRNVHWTKVPREKKARHRWESAALDVAEKLPAGCRAIHVMDQEADDFHVFHALTAAKCSFVIRGDSTRLTEDGTPLRDVLEMRAHQAFRHVRISRRPKATKKMRRPARDERDAELSIRFGPVVLPRPKNVKGEISVKALTLNVVHVFEPNPPEGEEPIEWVLFTSDPVSTFEAALEIVDHYRARWLIEEFFKALKTGCSFEKRQLTTYEALQRLLALLVPIAWQLLRIRYLARQPTPLPAAHVFDTDQLRLLRALLREAECDFELPENPTTRDVLFGLGALGGHIRQNGDPGWSVLWSGYEEFLAAARGWSAARNEM